ncbi:hypothetical protein ACFWGN_03215 [Oerskovia sp. NPDC060338]|uniref:hypothetical protein n=1 Tax=Oerskovia sp. NPDC060338 TaxID=3347100 RepID=UPI00364B7730
MAKLTAISRALEGHHRVCVGITVASDFAQRNEDAYDEVLELEAGDAGLEQQIREADWVVSVMNADLVFSALSQGRPVMLIDSLLAFWQLARTPTEIAETCRRMQLEGFADWRNHIAELSPHEQIYAAHVCATASVVQNFPGVPERVAELRALGAASPVLSGPIVDEFGLSGVEASEDEPLDLLINLGGFKNFLLDYDTHNQYLELISRWVPELVAARPELKRVAVCGGGYGGPRASEIRVRESTITFECMSQREFIAAVASARHYMLTPGLTAIHESIALGRFPLALPEEHYGHIANLDALRGTLFGRTGTRFKDLIEGYEVPPDDFAGTAAIVNHVEDVLNDDGAYRRFADRMGERIDTFVALSDADRDGGVAELRELLSGPSFSEILYEFIPAGVPDGRSAMQVSVP